MESITSSSVVSATSLVDHPHSYSSVNSDAGTANSTLGSNTSGRRSRRKNKKNPFLFLRRRKESETDGHRRRLFRRRMSPSASSYLHLLEDAQEDHNNNPSATSTSHDFTISSIPTSTDYIGAPDQAKNNDNNDAIHDENDNVDNSSVSADCGGSSDGEDEDASKRSAMILPTATMIRDYSGEKRQESRQQVETEARVFGEMTKRNLAVILEESSSCTPQDNDGQPPQQPALTQRTNGEHHHAAYLQLCMNDLFTTESSSVAVDPSKNTEASVSVVTPERRRASPSPKQHQQQQQQQQPLVSPKAAAVTPSPEQDRQRRAPPPPPQQRHPIWVDDHGVALTPIRAVATSSSSVPQNGVAWEEEEEERAKNCNIDWITFIDCGSSTSSVVQKRTKNASCWRFEGHDEASVIVVPNKKETTTVQHHRHHHHPPTLLQENSSLSLSQLSQKDPWNGVAAP